jgi:hypothetical protein
MHTTRQFTGSAGNNGAPEWAGQTSAGLSLLNVNWEDWGNPNPDHQNGQYDGCWRYTFAVNSLALAISFVNMSGGGDSPYYLPDHEYAGDSDSQTHIGTELSVRGPRSNGSGEPRDATQNIAIAPRHDPQLFSVIDGQSMRESLMTSCELAPGRRGQLGTVAGVGEISGGRENLRNGKQAVQRVREDNEDAMAVTGIGISAASLAVAGLATVFTGGTFLLVAGASLAIASIVTSAIKLFGGRNVDWLAPNRGFRVNVPARHEEPVAGYNVVFDAYVTPDSTTFLNIGSRHPVERSPNLNENAISDFEWKVNINAPPAPDEADVTDMRKYRSASLAGDSSFTFNSNQPPVLGIDRLSVPVGWERVSSPGSRSGEIRVDEYRPGDRIRLAASNPIRTTSDVEEFSWTVDHIPHGGYGSRCSVSVPADDQSGREFSLRCNEPGIWTTRVAVTDLRGNTGHKRYTWVVNGRSTNPASITKPEPGNELDAAEFLEGENGDSVELFFEAETGDEEILEATWSAWVPTTVSGTSTRMDWVQFGTGREASIQVLLDGTAQNRLRHPLRVKFEMRDCAGREDSDTVRIEELRRDDSLRLGGAGR